MYLLFFLIWIIFNGQFTWEIAAFGAVIAGVMYWFICKFLDYDPKTDIMIFKKLFHILHYVFILVKEIIKANFVVIKMIMSSRYEIEPAVVRFKTDLKPSRQESFLPIPLRLHRGQLRYLWKKTNI